MINANPIIKVGDGGGPIVMGVFGNFNARVQVFDCSLWVDNLGAGQLVISLRRPGETTPYAVSNVTVEGSQATWTFSDTDTAIPGYGVVFLTYSGESFRDATLNYPCYIAENAAPTGEVPDGLESWYQDMLAATAAAQQAVLDAGEARDQAINARDDADDYADEAAASSVSAAASSDAALASASEASDYAEAAEQSAQAAEQSAMSMAFVSFELEPGTGDLIMNNPQLLGTTHFALTSDGNLEVTI